MGLKESWSVASRPSACVRRSEGVQGAGPLAGLQGGSTPLPKKILLFTS